MQIPDVVVLAAGLGSRLGRPIPKCLTPLAGGTNILGQQVAAVARVFGPDAVVTAVVGFKFDLVMEEFPGLRFVYNEAYDRTNTARSLEKALRLSSPGGVLWLNGDLVFDPAVLQRAADRIPDGRSFTCVNTSEVGDEEIKYTVDPSGNVAELSKTVVGAAGEAIGINYVAPADKPVLLRRLAEVGDQDYFERGLELAIAHDGLAVVPVDTSDLFAVEVDFAEDLARADSWLSR
ncbi:MAG: NTP transferase domain-containing protein [Candidatus Nanopelagicales bacterium]